MKLYMHPMSSNARRVRVTARLLGLAPEEIVVDLMKGEHRKPEYLALNPNGKVPTLVDGDFVLWESVAIMMHLADRTAGQTLYPTAPAARAAVNQWLCWGAHHWGVAAGQLVFENMLKQWFNEGPANEYVVQRSTAMFEGLAKTLDAKLAGSRHIAGDALTLADVSIAAPLMYAGPAKLPLAGHANIERWFGELRALDAWQATEPR